MTSPEELVAERVDKLLSGWPPSQIDPTPFWGAQFDHGLAWVHFPEGFGGLGVAPGLQAMVDERLKEAGASLDNIPRNLLGYGMGGPTVLAHGTDSQKSRWLRPLFTAEELWCQLFSEPGAGSDLAGVATRAVADGEEWVINGQKVWTTLAHTARWGMLVARTNPELPKHRGLSYFIIDMHQPGVEVRPLRQMTGEAEFNEVYFTDARVPDTDRLGAIGDGWRVALTTLMNERVAIGNVVGPRGGGAIADAIRMWKEYGHTNPVRLDRLMHLWCRAEAMRLTNLRAAQMRLRGTPGPEGSTAKLAWAELNKAIYSYAVELMGADGMLYPSTFALTSQQAPERGRSDPVRAFIRARANSIEGGTTEILKNILGERVLGLPGEPRVDRDIPWRDLA
jgi:alkylation response protein AidB-like acyl-CoA dehydrogenase